MSRFKNIFEIANEGKQQESKYARAKPPQTDEKKVKITKDSTTKSQVQNPVQTVVPIHTNTPIEKASPKKGMGKSSNPDYGQALAYVRKDTLWKVKEKLFYTPNLDFSDLIETLLADWLKKQS